MIDINYNLIINFIIQHNYKYSSFKQLTLRSKFNNELISLSLVSKQFFEIVSKSLVNSVIGFKNYKVLTPLIDNEGNRPFKLIRNLEDSSKPFRLIKCYQTLQQYESDKNNSQYNKVMVNINEHKDSIKVLKNINSYPSGHLFNLTITSDQRDCLREVKEFVDFPIPDNICNINKVSISGVFKTDVRLNGLHDDLLKKVVKLNSSSVFYHARDSTGRHFQYNSLFNNKSAKVIKFEIGDHQEPFSICEISKDHSPKLEKLEILMTLHDIIRVANNEYSDSSTCQLFGNLSHESFAMDINSIPKLYVENMELLSKQPNLTHLSLTNFCTWSQCLDVCHKKFKNGKNAKTPLDYSIISNGFDKLLNSPQSKLTCLELHLFDFIDSNLLKSFSSNKTIRDLGFSNTNIEPFFKSVLNTNKTIRNILIDDSNNERVQIIKKYANNIDLHSIVVICAKREFVSSYIKLLKETQLKLNEIILIDSSYNKSASNSFQRVINNVILTVL